MAREIVVKEKRHIYQYFCREFLKAKLRNGQKLCDKQKQNVPTLQSFCFYNKQNVNFIF